MASESFSGYLTATAEQQRPRCAKRSVSALSSEAELATFLILVIAVIGGPICFWLVDERRVIIQVLAGHFYEHLEHLTPVSPPDPGNFPSKFKHVTNVKRWTLCHFRPV